MALGQRGAGGLRAADLGGAGQEDQHVAAGAARSHSRQRRGHLIFEGRGGVRGVLDFQRILAALGAHDARAAQVIGHGSGIERSRHHYQAQIGTAAALQAAEQGQGQIALQVALVELVEHHAGGALEVGIGEQTAGEHAFGQEAQPRGGAGDFLEAHLVTHGAAHRFAALRGHEARGQAGGQAAGFEHQHVAAIE